MTKLPNPLTDDFDNSVPAIRILSDRGIKQAITQGYLTIDPPIDLANPGKRLQPATIDLSFAEVGSHYQLGTGNGDSPHNCQILDAQKVSWVEFQEAIWFNNPIRDYQGIKSPIGFFDLFLDLRSSLLRLGATTTRGQPSLISGIEATILNSSQNNIILTKGERIAQAFIRVLPFADTYGIPYTGASPPPTPEGDKIRELEMGVQTNTDIQLEALSQAGFMKIEKQNGKPHTPWNGMILLHASRAFRTKEIKDGIEFANRDQYAKEDLLEEVDIHRKYPVKEGEHLIVEVEEVFDLSPHVGVSVLNNLIGPRIPGSPKFCGFIPEKGRTKRTPEENNRQAMMNCALNLIKNSWIDPGYKGVMTGFPKLLGKTIQTGEVVGYAQAFFFPKGVERPYGSATLGSQYQNQQDFQVVKS